MIRRPPRSTPLSLHDALPIYQDRGLGVGLRGRLQDVEAGSRGKAEVGEHDEVPRTLDPPTGDRKSTRLNSSHGYISYAVFCLKKKKIRQPQRAARRATTLQAN